MTGILIALLLWVSCWLLHRSQPFYRRGPVADELQKAHQLPGLDDPALMMDLMAAVLESGVSLERGLAVLARSATAQTGQLLDSVRTALQLGAPWDAAWSVVRLPHSGGGAGAGATALAELGQALRFAGTTGAPSAAIVRAQAAQFRRRRNREAERRAAALGVRLVVPLGLCSLPAFICLCVFPMLVGLFPSFG